MNSSPVEGKEKTFTYLFYKICLGPFEPKIYEMRVILRKSQKRLVLSLLILYESLRCLEREICFNRQTTRARIFFSYDNDSSFRLGGIIPNFSNSSSSFATMS